MPNKNTLFVGKVLQRFPSLPSTNEYAVSWLLSARPAEGAVVVADHQTAGRGQMGNSWEVAAGENLTFSLILYPQFLPVRDQFALNQVVSLAVRDAVCLYTDKAVSIKWPNDILVDQRKVCGILIQNTLAGAQIQTSIVGIGLNVNQEQFPAHLPLASSLRRETGRMIDLNELMLSLFSTLEQRYLQLRRGAMKPLLAAYEQHLFRRNESHLYTRPDGQQFRGTLLGVDSTGKLMMETERGRELFGLKEVGYVMGDR